MVEQKRTQKDRRADSDLRIITSAIRCFGKYGYANTTMNDIAKGAGVTGGLLIHRFESKENLFTSAYHYAAKNYISSEIEYLNFPDVFYYFIKMAKQFQQNYPENFKFLKMISTGTDLPDSFIANRRIAFEDRKINKILIDAQKRGLIIQRNRFNLFNAFFAQLYNELDLCQHYGLDYPDDSFFMRIFNFSETEVKKRDQQLKAMLDGIIKTFVRVTYISLPDKKVEQFRMQEDELKYETLDDAKTGIEQYINTKIVEQYRDEFREFCNLDTVPERLREKNLLEKRTTLIYGYDIIGTYIPIKRDVDGNVTEFLGGIQIVGKSED